MTENEKELLKIVFRLALNQVDTMEELGGYMPRGVSADSIFLLGEKLGVDF